MQVLRRETTGGLLLIVAALAAIVLANTPAADGYERLREFTIGPDVLRLHLTLGTWASDGLLAIFFFVAGLELKREFAVGDLRDPRRAALPVAAAVGGMALPALTYTIVNAVADGDLVGWAIPTATDIAFAVAVLAVLGSNLPSGLRTFLLTLAIVDDLLAITIIAIFYTRDLQLGWLALALVPLAAFAVLVQRGVRTVWVLLPLAVLTWGLVHASGVHATVAAVLLAFTVPARGSLDAFEHRVRPISAVVAVPVFAFFAAGVHVGGWSGLGSALGDPIAIGIVAGLVVGKTVGIAGSTYLLDRFTGAHLDEGLAWPDVIGIAALAGVGFTVSLLIGELAFGTGSTADEHVKVGVLLGSLLAIALAAAILRVRNRHYAFT